MSEVLLGIPCSSTLQEKRLSMQKNLILHIRKTTDTGLAYSIGLNFYPA